ncbi:MAG TPA: hypothetical protein VF941_20300 [Clostridia bacterium]
MVRDTFWFFIQKEIYDITEMLKEPLNLPPFYRDYENTWEWCEPKEENAELYFNIAREHDWEHGIYSCPVIFEVKKEGNITLSEDDVEDFAIKIVNCLKVDVFYGNVIYVDDSIYKYVKKRIFKLESNR